MIKQKIKLIDKHIINNHKQKITIFNKIEIVKLTKGHFKKINK